MPIEIKAEELKINSKFQYKHPVYKTVKSIVIGDYVNIEDTKGKKFKFKKGKLLWTPKEGELKL